jgi:PilZ domain
MSLFELNDQKLNRRAAFRIYDEFELQFRKINPAHQHPLQSEWTVNTDANQPQLQAISGTHHVNVSASGIAFNAKQHLEAGDYLMLDMQLPAHKKRINTVARVVYCRLNNPYDNDGFPYTIGTQFVNMTPQETEIVHQYVERRRKRQRIMRIIYAVLGFMVLAEPDGAFHLLEELLHHLLEEVLHVMHLVFEVFEESLDVVVEHLFESGRHDTQVIVFYIIVTIILGLLSLQLRKFPAWLKKKRTRIKRYFNRKKSSLLYHWSEQSAMQKAKTISIGTLSFAAYIFYLTL